MKKKICLIFYFVLLLSIANLPEVFGTTNCNQTFSFLSLSLSGRFGDEPVFWIVEDVGGECQYSNILQIVPSKLRDNLIDTSLKEYKKWGWLRKGLMSVESEPYIKLSLSNGIWKEKENILKIRSPFRSIKFDTLADNYVINGLEINKTHLGMDRSGKLWNENYGMKGIMLPRIEGLDAKLVYYYPKGLYVNYKISKVYYFANLNYLLVFTYQPKLANGLDTMHGFLIFKTIFTK